MKLKVLFILLLALGACSNPATPVDKVIDAYVAFIGGADQWQKVKTLATSGIYDYGGIQFPFFAYAKAPNFYKFVVPLNEKFYAQAFDGKGGWKIDAFKNETTPTMLTGDAALAMANEADVELEDAFIRYKEKGHHAVLIGNDTLQGRVCVKVELTRKEGGAATFYFDEKTYELVMKSTVSKNPEMNGAILNTHYSDYRVVEGIKIPFKALSESNGQMILTIFTDKAVINKPIEEREFQPDVLPK